MAIVPCAPAAPVHGVVQFVASEFVAVYPEFTGINTGTPAALTNNFTVATMLLNNSCGSRVSDANQRQTLLYLLVAHLTFLSNGTNDGAGNVNTPPGVVGRINSAAEGSVSVSAEYAAPPNADQAYYLQSKYGAQFWQLTSRYRTFLYQPAPREQGIGFGFEGGFGGIN